MRKTLFFSILLVTTFTLLMHCEEGTQGEEETVDYRDKFCGVYDFTTYDWYNCINGYSERPSFYTGRIEKNKESDSLILIVYKSGRNLRSCSNIDSVYGAYITPRIDAKGELFYKMACAANSGFSGFFVGNDSVKIYINRGGMGCSDGQRIIGVRKSVY